MNLNQNRSLLVFFCALFLGAALAQTGVGVSPPRVEIEAQPGDVIQRAVAVDNPGDRGVLEVTAGFNDFLLGPKGNALYLPPGAHERSLLSWMSVGPLKFDLAPKEAREVAYTIRVPADAKPGSYWGIVFFDSGPKGQNPAQGGVGVRFRVRVGHVIYVHVGKLERAGEILGFGYQPAMGKQGAQLRVNFQNTGNAAIRLNGRVEVRDDEGQLVSVGRVEDVVSLPGLTHEVGAALPGNLPPGRYVVLAVLDYGQKDLIAGEGRVTVP